MARYHNPKITTNKNLSLVLDAANPKSYTGVTTSVTTTIEDPYADNVSLLLNGNETSGSDPNYSSVSLLLNGNGTNGSTTFTDSSSYGHTVTPVGDAQISTAQSKFGGASMYFDGSGDYIDCGTDSSYAMGSGDFTIEGWFYYLGTTNLYPTIISNNPGSWTTGAVIFHIDHTSHQDKMSLWSFDHSNSTPIGVSTTSIIYNQWHHFAIVRSGTVLRLAYNGQIEATTTISASLEFNFDLSSLRIGGGNWGGPNGYFNGYIDDLRITKGVARYTSNFTPPTAELPGNTITDSSSYGHTVTANGNAKISTTQSKFGGASMYLDGAGDYLQSPTNTDFILGTNDFTLEAWIYPLGFAGAPNYNNYGAIFDYRTASASQVNVLLTFLGGSNLILYVNGSTRITGSAISTNQWTHVALTRSSGITRMFINGIQSGSSYPDTNSYVSSVFRIGGNIAGNAFFNGYIDDLRITKGVARYTSNFTPPAAELSLSTTETQQAPVLTDISLNNNTATLYNGVGYTSSNVGYFTFDGTNNYMEIPYDESVNLTDGDFTVEFWMNSFADQTSDVLVSYGNTSTVSGWAIKTATNKLQYSVGFATHPAVAGIVTSGLVVHLDAGDSASYPGSGTTWTDLSGNGNNGTLVNGVGYDSASGGSLTFDGVNDGVSVPGTNLSLNQMTISSWNYSTNYNQNGFMFEKTTNGTVNTQYSLFYNATGNNAIYYRTFGLSSQDLFVDTTTAGVVNNQWNNIVATFDGSQKKIYVNGVLRATQNVTGTVTQNSTGLAYIGIYGNFGGYPFNGNIASTQIYNKALTASEIQRNYNALKGRYTSPSPLDPLDTFGITENADFSSGITTNTWNHYALVRSGNVYTPYVNAVPGNSSYDYSADLNRDLYFDNASIILNANGDNGSTNIIDSSKNNHTGIITAYNGAGISTAESKFGGSSLYFDGTDDYIDCGTDPSYAMEDGDFTIEFWMYADQANSSNYVFRIGPQVNYSDNTVPDGGLAAYVNTAAGGSGNINFERKRGGGSINGASITGGQWNHIAWTREGDSHRFFVNGTLSYSTTGTDTRSPYNENDLTLGAQYYISSGTRYYYRHFNGYIDDFRITKGVAKYTEDFIPPNQASYYSNDPNYDNLSILLQGNGQNLSTSIIDSSPNNHTGIITAYNGAGISTAEYKFGGSSLYFDGTDDYIDCGISSDYSFGNDPFTIEFWMRVNTSFFHTVQRSIFTTTRDYGQFNQFIYGGIELEARIGYGFNDPNIGQPFASFYFTQRDNSGSNGTGFSVPDYVSRGAFFHDNWGHIAISCDGTYHRLFFNGVLAPSLITAYRQPYEGDQIIIGGRKLYGSISNFINAYIDDFRITKGVAKYTEDFIPPDRTKIQNNEASLKFGASGTDNNNPFNGALSNLKIYKYSLTQSEITQNYNAHKSRYGL